MEINKMVTRSVYILFVIGLITATLISMFLQILSIEEGSYEKSQFLNPNLNKSNDLILNDDDNHLLTFIQISDIHLSLYFDLKRKDDLRTFCTEVVDTVKPKVVIASGDLTDSRSKDPLGSGQYEKEWIWYSEVLQSTNVTKKTQWLDLRGNHDSFDIYNWDSANNFYKKYSNFGKHFNRHYFYNLQDKEDLYTFIAVDACVFPSPKRPFNFIGLLDNHDIDYLKKVRDDAFKNGTKYTVWFGHYPTSSIAMPNYNLKHILSGPYLSGHFHTLNGLVKEMYATHKEGSLELEVGDFKDNRIFRVAAIDHGIFSFVDAKLNHWPIILITNPKDSRFHMPGYETKTTWVDSTHIRVLVYSLNEIDSVLVSIDNSSFTQMETTKNKNLFVLKWNPKDFSTGLHQITVQAKDIKENVNYVTNYFSFDHSKKEFSFGGRFFLRISTRCFGVCLYLIGLSISLAPLLIAFYLNAFNKGRILKSRAKFSFFYKTLFKLYLLSSFPKISLTLFAIPIYLFVGPWYIGYILSDHIGIGFVWGLIIDGNVLPTALSYIWALVMIVIFHLPITCTLSHIIYCNYMRIEKNLEEQSLFFKVFQIRHIFFILVVFCNSLISYTFVYAYGYLTIIFGFGITWLLLTYLLLWYWTFQIKASSFSEEIKPRCKNTPIEESLIKSRDD